MKIHYFFVISFFSLFLFSAQVVSADCVILSTLKVGSRGAEVECLQQKVGAVADGRFGPITKALVITWQSNNGLKPDGIFGPLSLAVSIKNAAKNNFSSITPSSGNEIKPESSQKNTENINIAQDTSTNSNLTNLDQFINTVVEVNRKKGVNEEKLKLIADTLRNKMTTSNVDYKEKFKELLIEEGKLSANFNKHPPSFLDKALSFLGIKPAVAEASIGIPFGGKLFNAFMCLNFEWMIDITPLPPTNVVLLSYIPGTEGFASYNIPFTSNLLGTYSSFGECVIDYYPYLSIITEGTILPMTGSSPL